MHVNTCVVPPKFIMAALVAGCFICNWTVPPASNFISQPSFPSTMANSSLPPTTKTVLFAQAPPHSFSLSQLKLNSRSFVYKELAVLSILCTEALVFTASQGFI